MKPRQRENSDSNTSPQPSFALSWDMVAVDEVLVHLRITVLQLWLGVLFFLSAWPLTDCGKRTNLPEVVIPLRITGNRKGMRALGWLSYSLDFGGQRHIVHMKAKTFLVSRHLSVFTYTDQGALREDHPFVQSDCYYHGYIEGDPESMVSLTTCFGGFQGTLQIKDKAYEIEPKTPSSTFEHLVYEIDDEVAELLPMRCGLIDEETARPVKPPGSDSFVPRQSSYQGWWTHRWFIELAAVVDHNRFLFWRRNITRVVQEMFIIINEVNSLLISLDINVSLLGLEIWNERNFLAEDDIVELVGEFCNWKDTALNSRIENDIAHLFVEQYFGIYLGYAFIATVCAPYLNCAVVRLTGEDMYSIGHMTAHEIGHNLGMKHDDDLCTCGPGSCIMHPLENRSRRFSNCSYAYMVETLATKTCMRKPPKHLDIFMWKFCGNGVLDEGEECDCGVFRLCREDPCCEAGCTLKRGAECASGLCCHSCQFKPPGTVCREEDGECDLPEWCNGTSGECPEDVYVLAGSPCKGGGYCYEKRCNDHDEQCRQIFGKGARSATESCYKELNTRGDRFGNCGITNNAYLRCNISDILCGRVQCANVTHIPFLRDHSTVHSGYFDDTVCWSTDYHWGMTMPDIGEVKNGTACGPEHVCMHRRCVHKSVWTSNCSSKTCNMKGICNNKHHCHCNFRWDPPNCLKNGTGGSVDSGPPPGRKVDKPMLHSRHLFLPYFWVLFFVLLICLLMWLFMRNRPLLQKEEVHAQTLPDKAELSVQMIPNTEQLSAHLLAENKNS